MEASALLEKELKTLNSIFLLLPKETEIQIFPLTSNEFFYDNICSKQQLFELFFRLHMLKLNKNNDFEVIQEFENLKQMLQFKIAVKIILPNKVVSNSVSSQTTRKRQYSVIISSAADHVCGKTRSHTTQNCPDVVGEIDPNFMKELSNSFKTRICASSTTSSNTNTNIHISHDYNSNPTNNINLQRGIVNTSEISIQSPPNLKRKIKPVFSEKIVKLNGKTYHIPIHYEAITKRKLNNLMSMSQKHDHLIQENASLKATIKTLQNQLNTYKKMETDIQHYNSSTSEDKIGSLILDRNITSCPRKQNSHDMDLSWQLYSNAWALLPKASADGLTQCIPVIVCAWFASLGLRNFMTKNKSFITSVTNLCPSPTSFHKHIQTVKERIYFELATVMSANIPVTILHDKGERAGLGRLVKEFAYWDKDRTRVRVIRGCADGSDSTDQAVAASINITMSNIDDYLHRTAQVHGGTTDSGGGGTTESAMNELNEKYKRCNPNICYVNNCCMHAINRAFQVAFESTFGTGGLGEKNILQFLHTCWSIQDALGEQFSHAWNCFNDSSHTNEENSPLKKIKKPLLTRWGYVLEAASEVFQNFDKWNYFLGKIYSLIDTKEMAMSRFCCQLMKQPKLKCDLAFVTCFGNSFFNHHFAWLHRIDERTKTSGFSSHEMGIRIAIMSNDLEDLAKNWMSSKSFKQCTDIVNTLCTDEKRHDGSIISPGKETSMKQYNDFFATFIKTFNKNFKPWTQKLLAYTIASSNTDLASTYAKWFLDLDLTSEAEEISNLCQECKVHPKSSLSKKQWIYFLNTKCSNDSRKDTVLLKHKHAIKLLSEGISLYDCNMNQLNIDDRMAIQGLCEDVQKFFYIQAHITQSTERGVQETAICAQNQKGEKDTSSLVAIRSIDLSPVYEAMRKWHSIKYKKGNQHVSSGTNATRILRSTQAIRNKEKHETRLHLIPTKEKAVAHIQHCIDTCPPRHIMELMENTKKRRLDNQNQQSMEDKPNTSKKLRMDNFEKKILYKVEKKTDRDPTKIKMHEVIVPAKFNNRFNIKSFRRHKTLPYLQREVIAHGGNIDNAEIGAAVNNSSLKEKLACMVLLNERGVEQSQIDNAIQHEKTNERWNALLLLFGRDTTITLKHPENIEKIDELYSASSNIKP